MAVIRQALADAEVEYQEPQPGAFVANLPGQKRLKTACWLVVGSQGLAVEAFVVRRPEENVEKVHGWLLAHNARMFGVYWSIDDSGDIYLTGRWPLAAVTAESVDRLLGPGARLRRLGVQHPAGARFRLLHPARMGLAGEPRRVAGQPRGLRGVRQARPLSLAGLAGRCRAE